MSRKNQFEYDVYISYSHKDRGFAQKVINDLVETGLKVFVDYEQFMPGKPVIKEMERGILISRKTIVVLSPNYVQSQWSEFENLIIQALDPAGQKGKIIPILCAPTVLPRRLSYLSYIDFTAKNYENGLAALKSAIAMPKPKKKKSNEIQVGGDIDTSTIITGERSVITIERDKILLEEVLNLNKQILSLITNSASKKDNVGSFVFKNVEETIEDPKLCFVLMPFGPVWSRTLFENHIKKACEKEGLEAKRADDIYGVQGIMQDVWLYINQAGIIIGDLTTRNPNVFYEVGLAHAIGKKVILITQKMDDVPFDLRAVRCIVYSLELDGPKKFQVDLRKTLKSINAPNKNGK